MRALSLLPLLLFPAVLAAQKLSPKEAVNTLLTQNHLEEAAKPWHMKITFTAPGSPASEVEEWYVSPQKTRRVIRSGKFEQTLVITPDGTFREGDQSFASPILRVLLTRTLHSGPSEEELRDVHYQVETKTFGPAKLDCAMLAPELPKDKHPSLGLYPTYCFEPGTADLRATLLAPGLTLISNKTGRFLGNQIPAELSLHNENGTQIGTAKVEALGILTPDEAMFVPSSKATKLDAVAITVPGETLRSRLVTKINPVYPSSARQAHITGNVVLQAVIGQNGHVSSLQLLSSPDLSLTNASLEAVRQWIYKPYLVNGNPTEVDTTISVNFSMSN